MDVDFRAITRQCFIDRIVDNLIDKVVQPGLCGRPDVHCRAFADSLQALQDFNVLSAVRAFFVWRNPDILVGQIDPVAHFLSLLVIIWRKSLPAARI